MPIDKTYLILHITEAFKDIKLEEGIGLSEADAIDRYETAEVKAECRNNDEKDNWKNISSDSLNEYYCSLNFFDAKGMRFHLPAFMMAEIKGEYNFGMAFTLTHLSEYTILQFKLLNTEQRTVVKMFLQFLFENPRYEFEQPDIKRAMEEYWAQ